VSTRVHAGPLLTLEPRASDLPDVDWHDVGSSESKTMDAPNCQDNVKSMSFLVRVQLGRVEAIENFADLLQI
jgi:hypothetical protein